jgi:hypothetical protein
MRGAFFGVNRVLQFGAGKVKRKKEEVRMERAGRAT